MSGPVRESAWREFAKGWWRENPVFIAVLGLCPALAVTASLRNALVMSGATAFVLIGASLVVSALRHVVPRQVRISVYIVVIATLVTAVDFALAAWMPVAHRELGAFIALIVVNCLILGRQEAFASKNRPVLALADAAGMAGGFALSLCMIGAVRELLGNGRVLGLRVLPAAYEPWAVMILPPGGFFALGLLLTVFAWLRERAEQRRRAEQARVAAAARSGGGAP